MKKNVKYCAYILINAFITSQCFASDVVVTTGVIVQETSMNVDSLGGKFSSPKKWTASTYSGSTTAKYTLYENNLDKPVSSISWVKNLKVTYRTYNRAKGDIKTSATTITRVGMTDHVMIEISGNLIENYSEEQRLFAVRIDFSSAFYGVPIWYVFTQDPGYSQVLVKLDANGGTSIAPCAAFTYSTGKSYKQPTKTMPSVSSPAEYQQYLNSFVMPTALRDGFAFDAWYTRSDVASYDNLRIDETTLTSAAVTNIVAHWLLPTVSNVVASTTNGTCVQVSWDASVHPDVTYWIYRSEIAAEIGEVLAKTKYLTFEDVTANRGISYYYWIKVKNDETESIASGGAMGVRAGVIETQSNSIYDLTQTPADRAIADVTVDGDMALDEFVLKDGKVYDTVLRIVNTSSKSVNLTLPSGYVYETFKGATPLMIPANSRNILTITRTSGNVFLVTREELETVQ